MAKEAKRCILEHFGAKLGLEWIAYAWSQSVGRIWKPCMHFGHKTKGLAQSNNPLSHAKPLAQSTTLSHMHSHASQPQNHQETPFTHTCTYSFIIAPPFTHTCTYSFIIAPPIQHMHFHLPTSSFHPHALSIITTTFTLKQSPTYSPIPPIKTHAFIHKNHISFHTQHTTNTSIPSLCRESP